MAIIKSLTILLRGQTGTLKKDFSKATNIVSSFSSKVKSILIAAVPIVSVAGFVAGIKRASSELDVIGKRAVKLSIDTGELIALERAAGLAGAASADLETGTRNLMRTISDANAGNKIAADSLAQLGLTAEQLENALPTEQFVMVAKGLQNIESRADKTALAMRIFGRSGTQLLPLLSGVDQLEESLSKTQRLGGAFTKSEIGGVEAQNDAFSDLAFTFNNIVRSITVKLAPSFKNIFDLLTEAIKPGTLFNGMLKSMGDIVEVLLIPMQVLAFVIKGLSEFMGGTIGRIIGYAVAFAVVARIMRTVIVLAQGYRAVQASILAINTALASLTVKGVAKSAAAALVFAGVIAAINALELNLSNVFTEAANVADEFGNIADASERIKSVELNSSSAGVGSQEAFRTIFASRSEQPIKELVGIAKEGNAILEEMNANIMKAGQLDLGGVMEDQL